MQDAPPPVKRAWIAAFGAAAGGRFDMAGPLARRALEDAQADPCTTVTMKALVAASEGPGELALRALQEASRVQEVIVRSGNEFVLGQFLRARGDCAGATRAYESARAEPWHVWSTDLILLRPLLLHSLALCYEQVGDVAKAWERNEEMLRLWVNADPGIPLHAEARALQSRLVVK
jgi:hypothetical protein